MNKEQAKQIIEFAAEKNYPEYNVRTHYLSQRKKFIEAALFGYEVAEKEIQKLKGLIEKVFKDEIIKNSPFEIDCEATEMWCNIQWQQFKKATQLL